MQQSHGALTFRLSENNEIFMKPVYLQTYEEQHNKGHIYCTISHRCHNRIVCPLGNFITWDWLSKSPFFLCQGTTYVFCRH